MSATLPGGGFVSYQQEHAELVAARKARAKRTAGYRTNRADRGAWSPLWEDSEGQWWFAGVAYPTYNAAAAAKELRP